MKVYVVTVLHLESYSDREYTEIYATKELADKAILKPDFVDEGGHLWGYSGYIEEQEVIGL